MPSPSGSSQKTRLPPIAYQAFVADEIAELNPLFPADLVQGMSQAESAIGQLRRQAIVAGGLFKPLLIVEALGSGRLAGFAASPRRIVDALLHDTHRDTTARSIAAIVRATEYAIQANSPTPSPGWLAQIDSKLRSDVYAAGTAVRTMQTWAGLSITPVPAEFVPAPPEYVGRLLDDLAEFANRTDVPPIAQAAIAHAQFESICPLFDGNGRAGRCLIHALLHARGVTGEAVVPMSAVLATRPREYFHGLAGYRDGGVLEWCSFFASTLARAADHATQLCENLLKSREVWRSKAGRLRSGSAAERLLTVLPEQPVLGTKQAQDLLNVSDEAARLGLMALEEGGVLRRLGGSAHDRLWVAEDVFDIFDRFEYQMEVI